MANVIQHKRSATPSAVPTAGQLALGELGINSYDGLLFMKKNNGSDSIVTMVNTNSTQTLTNKTLTSPTLTNPTVTGTLTAAAIASSADISTTGGTLNVNRADANMARMSLINTNRNWSISNYGTQYSPNGTFAIADETGGVARYTITTGGLHTLTGDVGAGTLALNGATIGTHSLSVAGTSNFSNSLNIYKAAGPQIILAGATSNWIQIGSNGVAAPSFSTRSVGSKLVLYEDIGGASAGFALGIESSAMWLGVGTTGQAFKWYGGTTLAATLTGAGALTLSGSLQWNVRGILDGPTGDYKYISFLDAGTATWDVGVTPGASGQFYWASSGVGIIASMAKATGWLSLTSGITAAQATFSENTTNISTLLVQNTGVNGVNLKLIGNGATTPSKTIRVISGVLQIINSAYSTNILDLSDAGALSIAAGFTASTGAFSGNVTVSGNLGVGTAPSYLFHARKDQNAATELVVQNLTVAASAATIFTLGGGTSNQYLQIATVNNNGSNGYSHLTSGAGAPMLYIGTPAAVQFNINGVGKVSIDGNALYPVTNNSITLGGASNRWANIYGVLGNFTDVLTLTSVYPWISFVETGVGTIYMIVDGGLWEIRNSSHLTHLSVNNATGAVAATAVTEHRFGNHSLYTDNISIAQHGTGNRYAYLELHGDDTYTDYSARFLRTNAGPNADTYIQHRGNGYLYMHVEDAGQFVVRVGAVNKVMISSSGLQLDSGGTLGVAGGNLSLLCAAANTVVIGQVSGASSYLYVNGSQVMPSVTNAMTLGGSSYRWSTIYGVAGNFSGALTSTGLTIAASSAAGGTFYFNDSNTGGQVWQIGPGAGTGSPDYIGFYNNTSTAYIAYLSKTGVFWAAAGLTTTVSTADRYLFTSSNVNAQTGTSYTVVSGDNGKTITMNNASASTITIPSGLPAGFACTIIQRGAGQVTIVQGSGTSLEQATGLKLRARYSQAGLVYVASEVYSVGGDLTT